MIVAHAALPFKVWGQGNSILLQNMVPYEFFGFGLS